MISPRTHGWMDYAAGLLFLAAPSIWRFGSIATSFCYVVGAAVIVMSLMTAYSMGVFRVIPFRVHRFVDLVLGPVLVVAPWLFGFPDDVHARNFMVIAGLGVFVLTLMTAPRGRAADEPYPHPA
jgi:hypothetical protein